MRLASSAIRHQACEVGGDAESSLDAATRTLQGNWARPRDDEDDSRDWRRRARARRRA